MITHIALSVLASSTESKKSGPIGLAVILLLCVACYFLFKSMSRHLRKVREDFPVADEQPAAEPAEADDKAAENASTATPQTPSDAEG